MNEQEIAMQLTLKAMDLRIVAIGDKNSRTEEISEFYEKIFKTIHSCGQDNCPSQS